MVELVSRADAELAEDPVEVVFDGARADEQPRADLGVGGSSSRASRAI
jgi:hypothetical protein